MNPLFSGNQTKRQFQLPQLLPYAAPGTEYWGGSPHRARPKIPSILSNAVVPSPKDNGQNDISQPNSRPTGVQPSHGDAYARVSPSAQVDLSAQYSYERADVDLSEESDSTSLLPTTVARSQQDVHPDSNSGYAGLSDDTAPNGTVSVKVSSYATPQPVYVGGNNVNDFPGPYNNDPYLPGYDGLNSHIENISHDVFFDYGPTRDGALSRVPIHDDNGQPQQIETGFINVDQVNYDMDAFISAMGPMQNHAGNFPFKMGNHVDYDMSTQSSPADDEVQSQRPTGASAFESSQNSDHHRQHNFIPDGAPMKRKRSDSPEPSLSGLQSPARVESPTRHNQRRDVVGSPATREAGIKRRRSEAIHTCHICGHNFTRNHNRINHIRTHLGEAGTQCPRAGCGKHLAKSSLSRHLKNCRGKI